jgi:hypothetical protein
VDLIDAPENRRPHGIRIGSQTVGDPADLRQRIEALLAEHPDYSWDLALAVALRQAEPLTYEASPGERYASRGISLLPAATIATGTLSVLTKL